MKKAKTKLPKIAPEEAISRLDSISIVQKCIQYGKKEYSFRKSPKLFFENTKIQITSAFAGRFFQCLIYQCLASKLSHQQLQNKLQSHYSLKEKYIDLFHSLLEKKNRHQLLQYFFCLLCLTAEHLLSEIFEETIKRVDQLKIEEFSFIVLVELTLGILVAPASFRLLKEKTTYYKKSKDNMESGNTSHNTTGLLFYHQTMQSVQTNSENCNVLVVQDCRRKNVSWRSSDLQEFQLELQNRLSVKSPIRLQPIDMKVVLNIPLGGNQQLSMTSRNLSKSGSGIGFYSDRYFKGKVLKSSQCSSSLAMPNNLSFQDGVQSTSIKLQPIYSTRFYSDKKYIKINQFDHETQRERQRSKKKRSFHKKHRKRVRPDVQHWKREIAKLKENVLSAPIERLNNSKREETRANSVKNVHHEFIETRISRNAVKRQRTFFVEEVSKLNSGTTPVIIEEKQRKGQFEVPLAEKVTNFPKFQEKQISFVPRMELNLESLNKMRLSRKEFKQKYADNSARLYNMSEDTNPFSKKLPISNQRRVISKLR